MPGGRPSPLSPWKDHGDLALLVKENQDIYSGGVLNSRGVPGTTDKKHAGKKYIIVILED